MQLRLKKIADAYIAAKKKNYGPSEAKRQANKARSRTRVYLGLAFTCFPSTDREAGDNFADLQRGSEVNPRSALAGRAKHEMSFAPQRVQTGTVMRGTR